MTKEELYASMKAYFLANQNKVTTLDEPGVIAAILEAFASELETLYTELDATIDRAFLGTATGTDLDAIGALIGCSRRAGTKAQGYVRFTANSAPSSDITIPEGTRVRTLLLADKTYLSFETYSDAILEAGNTYVDVLCESVEVGSKYNVSAGLVLKIETPIYGVDSVSNVAAFVGGTDEETDSDYRARIPVYLEGLKRATATALISAAMSVDGIIDAVVEDGATPGTVTVTVASSSGTVPAETITAVEEALEDYRGAGIEVTVVGATNDSTNCSFNIYLEEEAVSATVEAACETAVAAYLNSLAIEETAYYFQIVKILMSIDGVLNIASLSLGGGTADITPSSGHKIVAGTISGTVVT